MEEQEITRRRRRRRIVLVPAPAQGHITPMMQLAKTLYLKGFLISIAQGQFNTLSSSSSQNFLDFDFFTIPESLPESELQRLGPPEFLMKLSKISEESFKNCICELMKQHDNDIAGIVYDELMYFSEAAAQEFKIPSFIFCTWSATNQACCSLLTKFDAEKFLIDVEDPKEQEKEIEELHPLKYKDLPTSGLGPVKVLLNFLKQIVNKRTASAMIINTVKSLENSSLSWLEKELKLPVYPLGPLHITASSHSSLMEEDRSCIEWLNKQKPNSVIYISVGSLAFIETNEVLEMAWGLCNSNQPFLWVIRPGSIPGSDWIESLPKEVSEKVTERGQIVKWVPQIEVLEHPAVGGFLSHCGWNSILESIAAGVPLICRPFQGEQKLNARCLESVWRIGIQLEGEIEREEVKRAVKRLMIDEEGVGMRERAVGLQEKFKASVRSGGSSYTAIDEFVKNLKRE